MLIIPTEDKFDWRQPPLVTIAIAFLCFAVFSTETDATIEKYALVPDQIHWYQIVTHQYLHGGWLHLGGNLLFLAIFGIALEKHLGALNYFTLYLLTGVCSGLGFALLNMNSNVPLVGASGAISGLMGVYLAVYGWRKREYFAVLGPVITSFHAPAFALLPIWLGYELLNAATSNDNVAYMAHAFGIMAGTFFYIVGSWFGLFHRRVQTSVDKHAKNNQPSQRVISPRALKLDNEMRLVEALAVCNSQLIKQPDNEALWYYCFSLAQRIGGTQINDCYGLLLDYQAKICSLYSWTYPLWQEYHSTLLPDIALWSATQRIQLCRVLLLNNDVVTANHLLAQLVNSPDWYGETPNYARTRLLPLLKGTLASNRDAALMQATLASLPFSTPSD